MVIYHYFYIYLWRLLCKIGGGLSSSGSISKNPPNIPLSISSSAPNDADGPAVADVLPDAIQCSDTSSCGLSTGGKGRRVLRTSRGDGGSGGPSPTRTRRRSISISFCSSVPLLVAVRFFFLGPDEGFRLGGTVSGGGE